jgi:hypothetical protein
MQSPPHSKLTTPWKAKCFIFPSQLYFVMQVNYLLINPCDREENAVYFGGLIKSV